MEHESSKAIAGRRKRETDLKGSVIERPLLDHPLLEIWRRQRLREAARGERNPTAVKSAARHVERFLAAVAEENRIAYSAQAELRAVNALRKAQNSGLTQRKHPASVIELIAARGVELAQKHVDALRTPGSGTIAASIRQFLKFLRREGLVKLDPKALHTPGIERTFEHPIVRDWETSLGSHPHYKHTVVRYFKFIAKQKKLACSPERETAAYKALAARPPQDKVPDVRRGKVSSLGTVVESALYEAEKWTDLFAQSLARSPEASREWVTQRLTGLRAFYCWAKERRFTSFESNCIVNPMNVETVYPPHPAVDLWVAQDNVHQKTRHGHDFTLRKFFQLIAQKAHIEQDPQAEAAATRRLLQERTVKKSRSAGTSTVIELLCGNPSKCAQLFLRDLAQNKTPPYALVSYLSHLRRFLDWAYQRRLITAVPRVETPRAAVKLIERKQAKVAQRRMARDRDKEPLLVWRRLKKTAQAGEFSYGRHPAEEERRVVPDLRRLSVFINRRNTAVETLVRSGIMTFEQAVNMRCWQLRLDKRRVGSLDQKRRMAWRKAGLDVCRALEDYLNELAHCRSCTRLWKIRGWNAPLFVSADGGALAVDDAWERAEESRRAELSRFISLRNACIDALLKRQKLSLLQILSLEEPVRFPGKSVALVGSVNQAVIALSNAKDEALLKRYAALKKVIFAGQPAAQSPQAPFFAALDGRPVTGDTRPLS